MVSKSFQFSNVESAVCLSNGIKIAAAAKHMTEDMWLERIVSSALLPKEPFARSLMVGIYSEKCSLAYAMNQIFMFQYQNPSYEDAMPRLIELSYLQCDPYSSILSDKSYDCHAILSHMRDLVDRLERERADKESPLDKSDLVAVRDFFSSALVKPDVEVTIQLLKRSYGTIIRYWDTLKHISRIYLLLGLMVEVHSSIDDSETIMEFGKILRSIPT